MSQISISIVVPCFNHGAYLQEAINSTAWKSSGDIEVIVVDDGSTDVNTLDVLELLKSDGIQVIHQKNGGPASARNNGISHAQGEFIFFLDSDNLVKPEYLSLAQKILRSKKDVAIVHADPIHFGTVEETRIHLVNQPIEQLSVSNYIDVCAMVRKSTLDTYGKFDENIPVFGNEDWELWMRLWKNGVKFHHIDEGLFYYRVADSSVLTAANTIENRRANIQYLVQKHADLYRDHSAKIVNQLFEHIIHQEVDIAQLRSKIPKASTLNESLTGLDADEKIAKLEEQKSLLNSQNEIAIESIRSLQNRITEYENYKWNRIERKLNHFRNKMRSNFSNESKLSILKKSFHYGRKAITKIFKFLYLKLDPNRDSNAGNTEAGAKNASYHNWLQLNLPTPEKLNAYNYEINAFAKHPVFSIVMPVYNPNIDHFKAALDSILAQNYTHWEVCLADDCSTDPAVRKCIETYVKKDERFKVVYRQENGHISAASNSALELVTGEYVVLMDQDDLITSDALFQNAKVINSNLKVDMIYSDEDKMNDAGAHFEPHFKPDWSPDNLLSRNYLCHLIVFNAEIMKEIGGWREGFEGSQDYDLMLRFVEKTDAIFHISMILYHWRASETSAAGGENAKPYAYINATMAINQALKRRNEPGKVEILNGFRGYSIKYDLKDPNAKVSIIIPTKDKTDLLQVCIESIIEKSTYENYEIIVIDNNSEEKVFFQYMDHCQNRLKDRFKCIRAEIPFNFSRLINIGAKESTGDYLVLLNNDTEVISPDWMEGMMGQAQRPSIGVVGVKLLYPNETIQHAGVVMGIGGCAGHVLVGEDRNGPGYFNYVNLINNYTAVTAACVMIQKEIFDEVNGFDEEFTVEFNDIDFCLRVKETGRNNIYTPEVELFHHESISRGHPHATKESYAAHIKESGLLKERWKKYIENDPCYNTNLSLGAQDFRMK